jgi:aminoglycoside phosphotransferase (APT) family kinase protein
MDGIGSFVTVRPMGPDDINADRMSDLMGADITRVITSRIGDGLVGLNLRVGLESADPSVPASVVIKLPSLDETSRASGMRLRNYEREVKFYLGVADTVGIRIPRCHHGEWHESSGDFILVLEDMAPAEQGNQVTGCTPEMAVAAVEELAKLHAPRWDDPTLDELDWLRGRNVPEEIAAVVGLWAMFMPGFLETYTHQLDAPQLDMLNTFDKRIEGWFQRSGPKTVTHGDYRLDNLLFGDGTTAPSVTAVDWQTPGHGSPIADLSYFCGAGLVPEERRTHDHALVHSYVSALSAQGVDVDEAWVWEQYRREAFAGVVMAVIASQVVGESERSEAMFAAMATRHLQHAIDLDSLALI